MRDLRHHPAVGGLHQLQCARAPAIAERPGQRLQDPLFFCRRQFRQDQDQPPFLLSDEFGESESDVGGLELRKTLQQIIAAEHELERQLRMQFLIARRHVLNRRDHGLQLLFRFVKLRMKSDDLFELSDLFPGLVRPVEGRDQLIGMRDAGRSHLDLLRLFRRNRKHAARLHLLFRGLPPAFPFWLSQDIADHPLADLLRRGPATEAFQNVANQLQRIFFRQLFD